MEMKRYRETKEKLRRRKEALKRRKLAVASSGGDSSASEVVALDGEDRDTEEAKKTEDAGAVCDSTSDLLIEKIVLGNSRVDELDEPLRHADSVQLKIKQKLLRKKRHMKHK